MESICDELIDGRSLRSIAKELRASATAVLKWLDREPGRMRQYQLARQAQADAMIDTLIELADEPVPVGLDCRLDSPAVNDKRLRIDTRKWIASKFHPGMYGDKVAIEASVNLAALTPEEIEAKILELLTGHGLRLVAAEQSERPGSV